MVDFSKFTGGDEYDAQEWDPQQPFEPLPQGRYLAAITKTEERDAKSGGGTLVEFTFQVLEGQNKGRSVRAFLNLGNRSEEAARIARGELSAICRATGIMKPRDSADLHDIPLVIYVKLEKRRDTGEPANKIAGYYPKSQWKESARTATTPASNSDDKAPWE